MRMVCDASGMPLKRGDQVYTEGSRRPGVVSEVWLAGQYSPSVREVVRVAWPNGSSRKFYADYVEVVP